MNTEERASKLLLELGVSIPIRTPGFLRKQGKPRSITMHAPTYGGIIRIANKYLAMGVTYEEVKEYTVEENLRFYSEHGVAMSQMIAFAVCGSYLRGRLFNKAVAWFLRWRVHPLMLQEAWFQLITLLDTRSFHNIIKSVEMINLMKPRLSHD
ncbi:hypothetical protein D0T50_09895 [Bacteroides sp. 214]|uniref:hypothetical protein n=1 Tax=Bacteroides sp. 214 TaxID=2302935 RepID=UPI0013D5C5D3|nr:hypothetical protein [Bacteroides sp. 214]NDW13205.1 hypothetical protein [Bacteroides sp. 214]